MESSLNFSADPFAQKGLRGQFGATLAEYALLVALIAAVVIPSVSTLSFSVRRTSCYAIGGVGYAGKIGADQLHFTSAGKCETKAGMGWDPVF